MQINKYVQLFDNILNELKKGRPNPSLILKFYFLAIFWPFFGHFPAIHLIKP